MTRCLLLAACVTGLMGSAVTPGAAQSVGALATLLPTEPGSQVCYARSYDADHLRRHPQQRVTQMTFMVQAKAYETAKPSAKPEERIYHVFGLQLQRRGEKQKLIASGNCFDRDGIACSVDCDGGGIEVAPKGTSLLVTLGERGIRTDGDCDGKAVWVKPGADDKVFRLDPAPAAACKALAAQWD